jgi:hypothetical protein
VGLNDTMETGMVDNEGKLAVNALLRRGSGVLRRNGLIFVCYCMILEFDTTTREYERGIPQHHNLLLAALVENARYVTLHVPYLSQVSTLDTTSSGTGLR